ncbi:MAG: hypothetical protein MJY84_00195 [Bacteroidales bacterium]|nr:hypothetical protein [Bacteroidales bacterium]
MRRILTIALCVAALSSLPSCKAVSSLVHDGEVVASYADHKLYRTDVRNVIPQGLSPEDSASFAKQYILSWARDKAFLDIAQQRLSKEEKDVSKDLEAYRQALLKYRYEQHYINERLDTVVTDRQIDDYYDRNKEAFRLDRPAMKARFVTMAGDSPNYPVLKKLMSSDRPEDVLAADTLAFNSTRHYHDYSDTWTDAALLAAEFGTDYVRMLSKKTGSTIEMPSSEEGMMSFAFIVDMVDAGEIPPVEFCRERICDLVVSERKRDLLLTLERDLLDEALAKHKFEIESE